MKAILAQIDLGFAIVEGLMLPDGTYAVSVPQIVKLFSLESSHAARDIKTLIKKSTLVNSIAGQDQENQIDLDNSNFISQTQIEGQRHKVNVIYLEYFPLLIHELHKKGNKLARAFADALFLEGLERRFDRVFKVNKTEEVRDLIAQDRTQRFLEEAPEEKENISRKGEKENISRKGFVYLIKCGELYKIGKTTNLERRIKEFAVGNPYPLILVTSRYSLDIDSLERSFHIYYRKKRIKGEWFELNAEEVLFFANAAL
jgi:hypothetical protein